MPMSRAVFGGLLLVASFVVRPAEPADTIMTLSRSACFGTCPVYRVEIRGNGEVTYQGDGFVLIPGTHHWHIDPAAVAMLLELFQRADYFNLKDQYVANVSDLASFETSLTVGGRRKSILDYGGSGMLGNAFASTSLGGEDPHMPPIVTEIENAIDEAAGTATWVSGDAQTMERLRAIKWGFRSKQAGEALHMLTADCNTTLARDFILAGAPVAIPGKGWVRGPAIASAAYCNDVDLARLFVSKGALNPPGTAEDFLWASVNSGYPEMVAIALKYYPHVNIRNEDGEPLISHAASAYEANEKSVAGFDSVKVVEMLIRRGANPNARDKQGNTPLFGANSAAVARALIAAGANPNSRNALGRTALFEHYFDEVKKVLIESGADVNARDRKGFTPLDCAGSEEAALMLLAAGAQLPGDPAGLQAWVEYARKQKWTKMLTLIEPRLEQAQHDE
jgi:hypothetical protein